MSFNSQIFNNLELKQEKCWKKRKINKKKFIILERNHKV